MIDPTRPDPDARPIRSLDPGPGPDPDPDADAAPGATEASAAAGAGTADTIELPGRARRLTDIAGPTGPTTAPADPVTPVTPADPADPADPAAPARPRIRLRQNVPAPPRPAAIRPSRDAGPAFRRVGTHLGQLYLAEEPLIRISDHAHTSTNEVGGFLTGQIGSDARGAWTSITQAHPALQARGERARLEIPPDAFVDLQRWLENRPDEHLVGWYHTHPGLGIFLSSYDTFLHRSFFGLVGQVALVADPVIDRLGVFTSGPQGGEPTTPHRADAVMSLLRSRSPASAVDVAPGGGEPGEDEPRVDEPRVDGPGEPGQRRGLRGGRRGGPRHGRQSWFRRVTRSIRRTAPAGTVPPPDDDADDPGRLRQLGLPVLLALLVIVLFVGGTLIIVLMGGDRGASGGPPADDQPTMPRPASSTCVPVVRTYLDTHERYGTDHPCPDDHPGRPPDGTPPDDDRG